MRIAPKEFTFDLNDRDLLGAGLMLLCDGIRRNIARKKESLSRRHNEKVILEIEDLDVRLARAQDLINKMIQ